MLKLQTFALSLAVQAGGAYESIEEIGHVTVSQSEFVTICSGVDGHIKTPSLQKQSHKEYVDGTIASAQKRPDDFYGNHHALIQTLKTIGFLSGTSNTVVQPLHRAIDSGLVTSKLGEDLIASILWL